MEKLEHYRSIILEVINFYGSLKPEGDDAIELEEILDREKDRFAIFSIGWDGSRRVHDCIMHIDIQDGKVLIQEDSTDLPVIQILEEKGILKEDLILGYEKI